MPRNVASNGVRYVSMAHAHPTVCYHIKHTDVVTNGHADDVNANIGSTYQPFGCDVVPETSCEYNELHDW